MEQFSRKVGFFSAFIIPALVITGFFLGGAWNFLTVIFSFIVFPLLDACVGINTSNVPQQQAAATSSEWYYRFVTYIWTFVQLAFLFWGAYTVGSRELSGLGEWMGFVLSFALVTGGIGITVAHELGHKHTVIEQLYARLILVTVCYMHFLIEHNRGHHVAVATPADAATARKDESFYRFWVRSVFEGYLHAWRLEAQRLRRKNKRAMSLHNEMILFAILPLLFCALLTILTSTYFERFAWEVPLFFFSQSMVAFTLLELVNYVEHYGIQRREVSPGRYERVNPLHSWNASHLLSNFFLFQLQRHSDHHVFASKRYQVLNHHNESPQLPYGYPTMIIIALLPPLWFRMMNTRLDMWRKKLQLQSVNYESTPGYSDVF